MKQMSGQRFDFLAGLNCIKHTEQSSYIWALTSFFGLLESKLIWYNNDWMF